MTREIDCCLNVSKILTFTPSRTDINKEGQKFKIPSLYLKILEHTTKKISKVIENYFSFYMEKYKDAENKEELLIELFVKLYGETDKDKSIEPYINTIGEEYLKLFYKYIWFKLRSPEIENFGKRFFNEIADIDY